MDDIPIGDEGLSAAVTAEPAVAALKAQIAALTLAMVLTRSHD